MKNPVQELTDKLDNLAIELSSTREELTSTKKEVKAFQKLLIAAEEKTNSTPTEPSNDASSLIETSTDD